MSDKKTVIKDIGIYAFASYLTQAIDIVISILMKRFLGPVFSGVWASLQVILLYAKHVNLGTTDATYREIPYLLAKNETRKAEEIKNTVFWFSLINALILAAGITIFTILYRSHLSPPVFWGLITIACLVILQRIYNYLVVLLRAYKNFTLAAKVMIFSSAAGALPLLFLTWKYKIYGFYAATLVIFFMNIVFILKHQKFQFPWTFSWTKLKPLIAFGFSIMILGVVTTVFKSIDRIIIPRFLGFEQMGYYTLAIMCMNYLTSFPNMIHIVLFPHFQEKFSQRDKPEDLKGYLYQTTIALAYLIPFLLGACWIFSELLVAWLLPQFAPGIFPLKILIVGFYFLCLDQQFSLLLITIKKHVILIPITAILTALSATLSWLAIHNGYGLPGVACIMSFSYFLFFTINFRLATKRVLSKSESLQLLARIMSILLYFMAVLLTLELLVPAPQSVLWRCLMRFGIFSVSLLPFVFILNRETRLWSHLKGILKDRFKKGKKPEDSSGEIDSTGIPGA